MNQITLNEPILNANDQIADTIRRELAQQGTLALNLLGSPGSGKTALLEALLQQLKNEYRCKVVEGDLETDLDAQRIAALEVEAYQVNTRPYKSSCHMNALMISHALPKLSRSPTDLLFIENVGNLVCPAEFDLGEDLKVTVLSVTEGEDKPRKYPVIFYRSDLVILNKIDLLPALELELQPFVSAIAEVAPQAVIYPVSARTGEGVPALTEAILQRLKHKRRSTVAV